MNQANKFIILTAIWIGSVSVIYFLSLLVHLPFAIVITLALALIFLLYKWQPVSDASQTDTRHNFLPYACLLLALYLIIQKASTFSLRHGEWDAWGIWNYHASFLESPANWKNMLLDRAAHPDYPLGLPAMLAFIRRLFMAYDAPLVSFAFSFFIVLCIPLLIYLEQYKKNIIVAAAALFYFATNNFFIIRGISQYADTLLAFFFLASFVSVNHSSKDKRYMSICAALLGCCMWTKNEGCVLAVIFMVFYARSLFSKANILYTIRGIAIPLAAFLIFKIAYAPPNDMVEGQSHHGLSIFFDASRYSRIWEAFKLNLDKNFYGLEIGFYLYFVICLLEKKLPGKQMLLLLSCLLAYAIIYVLTPRDLDWQLATSQDRLMHQLMPAMVYVLSLKLSEMSFLSLQKKSS